LLKVKREKPNPKKIAKSISSFANSYGGIYFIGIEADSSTNFATDFIGVEDSPDVIRDSVRGHLQPFPYFETFSINLNNGKKVLMAVIPEGRNPPYIYSDGRIYRRQEAASDPISENNRHAIDELYRKALKYEEELEKFRNFDLTFCRGEDDHTLFGNIC
jgi:predicted HTH transcriptional regulator